VRQRVHLNGSVGQVMAGHPDSAGRVAVRLPGSGEFKIHHCRLRPAKLSRAESAPSLEAFNDSLDHYLTDDAPLASAGMSVRTPSVVPSIASQCGSQQHMPRSSPAASRRSASLAGQQLAARSSASESFAACSSEHSADVGGGVAALQRVYARKRARWKQSYLPHALVEKGMCFHNGKVETPITMFEKEFMKSTGMSMAKAYAPEEVKLFNKNGMRAPSWSP